MRLTKNLKVKIIERFKNGAWVRDIAIWYGQDPIRIEQVIREAMIAADRQAAPVTAAKLVAAMDGSGAGHE